MTDVVRTETRKEDMRMIEDTRKWVLSPERKAPKATREYAAHRLDTVLDKFLKTMQTTAARLQEKLLKPEARQKGKEQVKERASPFFTFTEYSALPSVLRASDKR